jgi:hypothetical protein
VAGVATLLIALGVGVLIGHDSSNQPLRAASTPVITVNGGGAANTTAAGNGNAGAQNTGAKGTKGKHKTKTVVVHITPKVAKAATSAASKVFGSGGNLSHNVTQKVGGSCNGGAGCQNHHFTGNFFNP